MQPANQCQTRTNHGDRAGDVSEFQESCPGFEKRLKAWPRSAVEAIVRMSAGSELRFQALQQAERLEPRQAIQIERAQGFDQLDLAARFGGAFAK
jgi:hypothetical protein